MFDKANFLRSNAFMRKIFDEVAARHPDIGADCMCVDAGSMMMVINPARFDVIVAENVFGDIVSEVAASIVGGLVVAPSAGVSKEQAVFQPCHGTAPDIAGKGIASPLATILSDGMMLDWIDECYNDISCLNAAASIRTATARVLQSGPRTRDLAGTASSAEVSVAIAAAVS